MDLKEDMKMQKIDMEKLTDLNKDELRLIAGGGLTELTSSIVDGVGYVLGWFAGKEEIPASESTLLGPNSRPIM